MPSKKNKGGPKGKGPAEKTGHKRPLRQDGSSSDEDSVSMEDLEALLQHVTQVEKNRGVDLGGAGSGPTRRASKKQLFKSLLSRVSILESASTVTAERAVRLPDQPAASGAAEGSSMVSSVVQTITSPEAHPSVQASSGSLAAAVTGPSQPAALASTSSAVAGSTQSVGLTAASTDVAGCEQLVTAVPAGTARLVHRGRILVVGIIMSTGRRDTPGPHPLASIWVALPLHWSSGRVFGAFFGPVLHIGGNDLGLLSGRALYLQARADIFRIWQAWPRVHIAWSAIIPRLRWPGGGDVRKLEKARWHVNRAMRTALARGRGFLHTPWRHYTGQNTVLQL
ncbi:uncharacterized protein [Anolis sagrei]|uniref:uncharacterized protein n=1 Tax=Anolis sagrei TaxID=38937 RepID=UPI003521826C